MRPILCPVCGHAPIEPVHAQATVTLRSLKSAKTHKEEQGDVIAYRCKLRGHVFFVRPDDLTGGSA
jgi:hypothetical protein